MIRKNVHAHTCDFDRPRTHIHIHTHTHAYKQRYTYMHAYTHTWECHRQRNRFSTNIQVYKHTYIHIYTYTHVRISQVRQPIPSEHLSAQHLPVHFVPSQRCAPSQARLCVCMYVYMYRSNLQCTALMCHNIDHVPQHITQPFYGDAWCPVCVGSRVWGFLSDVLKRLWSNHMRDVVERTSCWTFGTSSREPQRQESCFFMLGCSVVCYGHLQ